MTSHRAPPRRHIRGRNAERYTTTQDVRLVYAWIGVTLASLIGLSDPFSSWSFLLAALQAKSVWRVGAHHGPAAGRFRVIHSSFGRV